MPVDSVLGDRRLRDRCCVAHGQTRWSEARFDAVGLLDGSNPLADMYTGAKTVVRTVYGNSSSFEVKVGMHQGSALSPLLSVIVREAISRRI